jgi:hypothetical protein
MKSPLITLTTDFGSGLYVSQMKGKILTLCPTARIVDITHDVTRHDITEGAFVLAQIWPYFPQGTIHVGVIDPGVGTARRCIVIKTGWCWFVGPDNGLFTLALRGQEVKKIGEIDLEKLQPNISPTFHGRDVFAPVAAHLARGTPLSKLTKPIDRLVQLKVTEPVKDGNTIRGEVLYVDAFGNVITNIRERFEPGQWVEIRHRRHRVRARFVRTFADVNPGDWLILVGSHGFLEIDVNRGSAAQRLRAQIGDAVRLCKSEP